MLAASPSNILNHYGPVQTDDKRLLFLKLASAVENQTPSGRSIDFGKMETSWNRHVGEFFR